MKLKLEHLAYQQDAIDAVTAVFNGQFKHSDHDTPFIHGIYPNALSLKAGELRRNIATIIAQNGLEAAVANPAVDEWIANHQTQSPTHPHHPPSPPPLELSIEMETGTGKTLVYIQTIFELFQHYGFTKFIILVPSIAIKEGVLQTWKTFKNDLDRRYNVKPNVFEYDSKKLAQVRHFASQNHPQVMIMTLQSFNSDDRILNQSNREGLPNNSSYMEAIARTRPIVIMDEPQEGMDTENAIARFSAMNPLCKIRYSATHKVPINLIYRLTPYQSYEQRLVKKIEILTVSEKNDEASMKLELMSVDTHKDTTPKAIIKAWHKTPHGTSQGFIFKPTPKLANDANLEQITKNIIYKDYVIERISKPIRERAFVAFTNGVKIYAGVQAKDYASLFNIQLYWLIESHFKKRDNLKKKGIKCLSLIFIDRVAHYVERDGIIKKAFVKQYKKVVTKHYKRIATKQEVEEIQGSYFAQTGKGDFTDNERSMQTNKELYDLILKDKEKLLSFENPVEFIFSHSALGVGWDNPNVCNIATLNHRYSEIKKRQEIGRGLRICVDQNGNRIHDAPGTPEDEEVNILTVIPNESYQTFLSQYQSEIQDVYGSASAAAKLRHSHKGENRTEKRITRNESHFNSAAFRKFWKKLAQKTDYLVSLDEKTLIRESIAALNTITIPKTEIEARLDRIQGFSVSGVQTSYQGTNLSATQADFAAIDIVSEINRNTQLCVSSVAEVLRSIANQKELINNPPRFIHEASQKIKAIMLDNMIRALEYSTTGEAFDLGKFKKSLIKHTEHIEPTPCKGLYDHIVWDSEFEKQFAAAADRDTEVVCFLKLPPFYVIKTPVGDYNPDFGLILKKKKTHEKRDHEYYFVIEIKGTNALDDRKTLSQDEVYKIKCAKKHFKALGINVKTKAEMSLKSPAAIQTSEIDYKAPIRDYNFFKGCVA